MSGLKRKKRIVYNSLIKSREDRITSTLPGSGDPQRELLSRSSSWQDNSRTNS